MSTQEKLFFQRTFMEKYEKKIHKSETRFSKQFCLNFFFVFSIKISRMGQKKVIENRTAVYLKCVYNFFFDFLAFLLLWGLISKKFTIFFRGSSIRLARCDSYWYLVFFFKILSFFIQICKMRHCPPSVTLALLLFIGTLYFRLQLKICSIIPNL